MNETFRHTLPIKWETALFILFFAIAVFTRLYCLSADSPQGITFSQGIETDPPQYTIYARNDIQQGEWNPYHDDRYVTYQYSFISLVSRFIYGLFGVGTYQANLTAAILSLLTIMLFYFVVRRSVGNVVALFALFFVSINYLYIFYGRKPFLEVGMNFLFVLGLFFLSYWEQKKAGHFLWGICLAGSIFFGKIIGLAFLFVPIMYYLFQIFYVKDKKGWGNAISMSFGFLLCAGIWYVAIFEPHASAVTGYVGEQAFGLYGLPEAFQSVIKFVWKFVVFGRDSEFFDRMPIISVIAVFALLVLFSILFRREKLRQQSQKNNIPSMGIAVSAWLIGTYLAQMPWNYQPVRYEITMVFPLSFLAAFGLVYVMQKRTFRPFNGSIPFAVVSFVLLLVICFQLAASVAGHMGVDFYFKKFFPYVLFVVTPAVILYYVLARKKELVEIHIPAILKYAIVGLLVLMSCWGQAQRYYSWAKLPLYTARQASLDLAEVLSPGAVISGPFGPALALDNSLGCVIHIFGTSRPDSLLFKKYPITHLALERSNEEVARKLYPDIMKRAMNVCRYYINCRKVTIYRIAYATGNPKASEYFLSNFEKAIRFYELDVVDSADFYLNRFQKIYPENISGNRQMAYKSLILGEYDTAITFAKRAVSFSPTDFSLHYILSKAYIAEAKARNDDSLMELSKKSRELATLYNLGYVDFDDDNYSGMPSKEIDGKNASEK